MIDMELQLSAIASCIIMQRLKFCHQFPGPAKEPSGCPPETFERSFQETHATLAGFSRDRCSLRWNLPTLRRQPFATALLIGVCGLPIESRFRSFPWET